MGTMKMKRTACSPWMLLVLVLALSPGCAEKQPAPDVASDVQPDSGQAPLGAPLDTIAGSNWTTEDWRVLDDKVRWGVSQRLDTLPMGSALAKLGVTFVGTTYTPGTLEAPGPEHLVINLRELDCVTFIENLLALSWFIRNDGTALLADRPRAMAKYEEYLTKIRYRDGRLDGYPSRLHYFSEWLSNGQSKGILRVRTQELGGVPDPEPINFMSTHRDAYKQLADSSFYETIKQIEARLNAQGPRIYIPETSIAAAAPSIHDGDLIAVTSTLPGLDIAHTGVALWQNGRLHLLHAPLVGKSVEISEVPLAERILGFAAQDGIMVAEPREFPGSARAGR